jgi:hypothetical protein
MPRIQSKKLVDTMTQEQEDRDPLLNSSEAMSLEMSVLRRLREVVNQIKQRGGTAVGQSELPLAEEDQNPELD